MAFIPMPSLPGVPGRPSNPRNAVRGRGPVPASSKTPVFSLLPSIVGTPRVGSPVTFNDGLPPLGALVSRRALIDGTTGVVLAVVFGAADLAYIPQASDLNRRVFYRLSVTILGATVIVDSEAVLIADMATPGDIYALLNPAETAFLTAHNTELAKAWNPNLAAIAWDDQVTIASSAELYNFLNGTSVGNVTRNVARNQKITLQAGGDFSYASRSNIDRLRGMDWFGNGKVLLIDGNGQTMTSLISSNGCRGVYIRNLKMACTNTIRGADTEYTPGFTAATVSVSTPGTGYQVGQVLTLSGGAPTASIFTMPTIVVASVDANGGILTVDVTSRGVSNRAATDYVATSATSSNARLANTRPTNPREIAMLSIARTSTFPLMPIFKVENVTFGTGSDAAPWDYMTGLSAANCEQVSTINCTFNGVQTGAIYTTVRRIIHEGNDVQLAIGDGYFCTNIYATTAVGAGQTFDQAFPDRACYVSRRFNTLRNMFDNRAAVTPVGGHLMGLFLEHTDVGQHGTTGDNGGYKIISMFNACYGEAITYYDSALKNTRYGGGAQVEYNDDSPMPIETLSFSNLYVSNTIAAVTSFNGTSYAAYNTIVRSGQLTPDGVNAGEPPTTYNYPAGYSARQKLSNTSGAAAYVRNCIAGQILTQGDGSTTKAVDTFVTTDNLIADPRTGVAAYADVFKGAGFTTNVQLRLSYPSLDVPGDTQAQFRARLWSMFEPKAGYTSFGTPSPALWPVA